MATTAQKKATKKYLETQDEFKVRVPKGIKAVYQEQANRRGFKSLNAYVISLIEKDAPNHK